MRLRIEKAIDNLGEASLSLNTAKGFMDDRIANTNPKDPDMQVLLDNKAGLNNYLNQLYFMRAELNIMLEKMPKYKG